MKRYARELSVAAVYLAILGIMALVHPVFFKDQFKATWIDIAPMLVLAIGMTLVIIARHIDISIGSQVSICVMIAGLTAKLGLPMPLVALCTCGIGAAMGALNGVLIAVMGLPSIVVTLATMVALRQSLNWIGGGRTIPQLPAGFQWLGQSQSHGQWILLFTAFALVAIFARGMRDLAAGRAVYAVGSDAEAARLAGLRPRRVVFGVFVLMGILVGLAALLQATRFSGLDPKTGTGWELSTIAAVVVGGTAISGGRGTILGSLIGVALLTTIAAVLPFFGSNASWDQAIQGGIILIAVASDSLYAKRV